MSETVLSAVVASDVDGVIRPNLWLRTWSSINHTSRVLVEWHLVANSSSHLVNRLSH